MIPENEPDVFKWVTGILVPVVGWAYKILWSNSKELSAMSVRVANTETRISETERDVEESRNTCSVLQKQLADNISESLKRVFEGALSKEIMDQNKELASINQNIALLAQRYDSLYKSVSDLTAKVEQEKSSIKVVNAGDTGQRRRFTDYIEERR